MSPAEKALAAVTFALDAIRVARVALAPEPVAPTVESGRYLDFHALESEREMIAVHEALERLVVKERQIRVMDRGDFPRGVTSGHMGPG
jgi:hypothetical protein